MSRSTGERLNDILVAVEAIRDHVACAGLHEGVVFDAVRMRLIEIGEAVKAIPPGLLATEPSIDWSGIARTRDHVTHRYFGTAFAAVAHIVANDLTPLSEAARRLLQTG